MTGAKLTKAQDKVEADRLRLGQGLDQKAIDAGMGHVGYQQNRAALAARGHHLEVADEKRAEDRVRELRAEVERRAGPGNYRLPHGVGKSARVPKGWVENPPKQVG